MSGKWLLLFFPPVNCQQYTLASLLRAICYGCLQLQSSGYWCFSHSAPIAARFTTYFDKLVSLICADRLKELIPKSCLDYILAQEKDSWLKHDDLATSVGIYMASNEPSGLVIKTHNAFSSVSLHLKTLKPNTSQHTAKAEKNPEPKVEMRPSREEM